MPQQSDVTIPRRDGQSDVTTPFTRGRDHTAVVPA